MNKSKIVELQNVTKKIGNKEIVKEISFDVFHGEIFGFLGPNGAGKTTTIRMMVGLMEMSQGDIIIKGNSINKNFKKAIKNVGAVIENPDLYKYLTGYQNLKHYARMSSNISKNRINEIVEVVGLKDSIHKKVGDYSLGMKQRLGIAQALLHQPSLLILDEPTNGLDPEGIHELRDYLKKLSHEEGISVFVSSHLLSEIELMCDRVGILKQGELIDIQDIKEINQEIGVSYINITVDKAQTTKAASLINSLEKVELINNSDKKLLIKIDKNEVPNLNKFLVKKEIKIYSIELIKRTLEDKFLEITKEV